MEFIKAKADPKILIWNQQFFNKKYSECIYVCIFIKLFLRPNFKFISVLWLIGLLFNSSIDMPFRSCRRKFVLAKVYWYYSITILGKYPSNFTIWKENWHQDRIGKMSIFKMWFSPFENTLNQFTIWTFIAQFNQVLKFDAR